MDTHGAATEASATLSTTDQNRSDSPVPTKVGQTTTACISSQREVCDAAATSAEQTRCDRDTQANTHASNSAADSVQASAVVAEAAANGFLGGASSSADPHQQDISSAGQVHEAALMQEDVADKQGAPSTPNAPDATDPQQQHGTVSNSSQQHIIEQQSSSSQQQDQQQQQQSKQISLKIRTGDKRSLEDRSLFSPTKSPPTAAAVVDTADQAGGSLHAMDPDTTAAKSLKRRKASCSPPTAAAAAPEGVDDQQQQAQQQQQQQQQHAGLHRLHSADHSHIRRHHAVDEDVEDPEQPATTAAAMVAGSGDRQAEGQQQQQQRPAPPRRKKVKGLLSFGDDDSSSDGGSSSDSDQQQYGGLSAATASRFKQEAKRAAAASRYTFKPSSAGGSIAAAGSGAAAAAGGGLVDDDVDLRVSNVGGAAAALSQIHFGFAAARGHRPYMEDRHTIITALNPTSAAAAAALAADDISAAAAVAAANGNNSSESAAAAAVHDGVGRSYAAIFDGHNGAGAAETAARKLHLLLASHPAMRLYRGETGPPAVIKQEEAAVAAAIKAAFRQVDDMVLGTARREGTRDGATALVVLRLGHALYAAHAGDSRAVLCRDAAAYRLTEDHKPHLPHERSRIEEAGGRVDFQRCWRVVVEPRDGRPGSGLAVSRSLGDLDFKEPHRFVECDPDVKRLLLQPKRDTFVVLASDGLWDVLSDTDAVITTATALKAYAAEHGSNSSSGQASNLTGVVTLHSGSSSTVGRIRPRPFNLGAAKAAGANAEVPDDIVYSDAAATAAAEALLSESMRRGTMDNVTVIVMLLQWS